MTEPRKVGNNEAFEILCADCLRSEPFPREIQVTGQAIGWAIRIKREAEKRGWSFSFTVSAKLKEPDEEVRVCPQCGGETHRSKVAESSLKGFAK